MKKLLVSIIFLIVLNTGAMELRSIEEEIPLNTIYMRSNGKKKSLTVKNPLTVQEQVKKASDAIDQKCNIGFLMQISRLYNGSNISDGDIFNIVAEQCSVEESNQEYFDHLCVTNSKFKQLVDTYVQDSKLKCQATVNGANILTIEDELVNKFDPLLRKIMTQEIRKVLVEPVVLRLPKKVEIHYVSLCDLGDKAALYRPSKNTIEIIDLVGFVLQTSISCDAANPPDQYIFNKKGKHFAIANGTNIVVIHDATNGQFLKKIIFEGLINRIYFTDKKNMLVAYNEATRNNIYLCRSSKSEVYRDPLMIPGEAYNYHSLVPIKYRIECDDVSGIVKIIKQGDYNYTLCSYAIRNETQKENLVNIMNNLYFHDLVLGEKKIIEKAINMRLQQLAKEELLVAKEKFQKKSLFTWEH